MDISSWWAWRRMNRQVDRDRLYEHVPDFLCCLPRALYPLHMPPPHCLLNVCSSLFCTVLVERQKKKNFKPTQHTCLPFSDSALLALHVPGDL